MNGWDSPDELLTADSYRKAVEHFRWEDLWSLFSGDRQRFNITVECIDRHQACGTAVRLQQAGAQQQRLTFEELAAWTSQFAHYLESRGVERGDRVAVMLEPSLGFYTALFGTIKRGAVAVPLFTLFGPDAVRARLDDCTARLLVVGTQQEALARALPDVETLVMDARTMAEIRRLPDSYEAATAADDLAVLQYTSGTSRQLPAAVPHKHRAMVTLVIAALYGLGLKPGDRYFCPSSPAWGHGLWHGTISPWMLGIAAGAYSGRFDPAQLRQALDEFRITNLAAAGTVYRMLLQGGHLEGALRLEKASYTGESLDPDTLLQLQHGLGTPVCGMYGTTETGVIIANFPGFADYEVRPGALGKPVPGCEVTVVDGEGTPVPAGKAGEIAVRRRSEWFRSKDLGQVDGDGYFWYLGRADDVIISAGWTISPIEVENALAAHPDVVEAAVIGVPDPVRGQVLKAFVVSRRTAPDFVMQLQEHVRHRLSHHEYPRHMEFVHSLPKTSNGKINRRELRLRSGLSS